ncbi:F-box/FBD/LRR-repeat protein At1g13570-like isoform X1 [Rutidosis leptorrhynchoides]|uniref:F-box/FBD/LRR-repeat protein At1g13570-like isoform X1 n=1 Tax=Rutidosis leptorrhynchoides TaxID=125765 RepID=UPI003A9A4E6D
MELIQGTRKASNLSLNDDIISSMPDIVITYILNHLPIQDAVRTSILARNWRFKWTLLTQLVFDRDFVKYLYRLYLDGINKNKNKNWYDERIISNLLTHVKGPITKFYLRVPNDKELNVKDLHNWVLILSRKGIMEFTLLNGNGGELQLELPTHIFSCLELTHLKLSYCDINSIPTCVSFTNLLSLEMLWATFAIGFCDIITSCPRLEILKLGNDSHNSSIPKLKLVEITKLTNLKILSFPLCALDSMPITNSLIFHLGRYLPKLQELYLSFLDCKFVLQAVSSELVRDSFSYVKTLKLDFVDFSNSIMLPFALEMVCGCPNLQTLKIRASYDDYAIPHSPISSSELNYITMGQLQLLNVVFYSFGGLEDEFFLIKNLLARTPLLKKFTIYIDRRRDFSDYREKMFAKKLLMFHRASAIAEVDYQCS